MTWHKQTVLLHLPSPHLASSLTPFWMLSCWCDLCSSLPLALSTAHVMCSFMCWYTHTHTRTFPSWRQISALKSRWHGYAVWFYFCLSLSLSLCVVSCVCVEMPVLFRSLQITQVKETAPEDSEMILELSAILVFPHASCNSSFRWD